MIMTLDELEHPLIAAGGHRRLINLEDKINMDKYGFEDIQDLIDIYTVL